MKSAIFLTVRSKSSRLPGKSFLKIKGRTTIEHLIDRMKLAKLPDMVILCTSTSSDDKVLTEIAKNNSIPFFQGSEEDKLERYVGAADKYGIDFIVTVDGDDLFCDPDYIDKIIERFKDTDADFILCEGLPFGAAPHGIKLGALRQVCESKKESDTEVWGDYFLKNKHFKKEIIKAEPKVNHPEMRMSLDYKEDFDFFTRVFDELGNKNDFPLVDIVNLLIQKPEIQEINKHMHKAYEKNIKEKRNKVEKDLRK